MKNLLKSRIKTSNTKHKLELKKNIKGEMEMIRNEPTKVIVMTQEQLDALIQGIVTKQQVAGPIAEKKMEKLLTYTDVMEIFGIGRFALWRWVKKGDLKAIKTGKLVMFEKAEIERFLAKIRGGN